MNEIARVFLPVVSAAGLSISISLAVYLAIRYLAYRRSFPVPHQFDFFWVLGTVFFAFVSVSGTGPLEGQFSQRFLSWTVFATFLLWSYVAIFVADKFLVEYLLVRVFQLYVAPPLRKAMILFVFAVAAVVGVQQIFNINPWAIYAPTSVISLGIGIALKDAFQTFFAGVALSRILRIGDWIRFNELEGQVTDMNWARTALRTWEGGAVFVPNSELQKSVFQNFSYRSRPQRCRVEVGAAYGVTPQKVKAALAECARNAEGVAQSPAPEVLLMGYGDFSINYALTFWVEDYSRRREVTSGVSTRVWYAFKREGIEIPFPIRTVHMAAQPPQSQAIDPQAVLSKVEIFRLLTPRDHDALSGRLRRQVYLKGEVVVREGEPGSSFYVVHKGRLEILRKVRGHSVAVGELESGQFFGELSLLTGEPRSATVRAVEDSELLLLDQADFRDIMERNPDLAESIAEVVASRQAHLQAHDASVPEPKRERQSALSRKIREFFNLKREKV